MALADPDFYESKDVDLLIAAEIFYDLLLNDRIHEEGNPTLHNTRLDLIVSGTITQDFKKTKPVCNLAERNQQLEIFWQVEEVIDSNLFTKEEQWCKMHFNQYLYFLILLVDLVLNSL